MLMIGFIAKVHKGAFQLSQEVDQAVWVRPEQARTMLHPDSTAISRLVLEEYLRRGESAPQGENMLSEGSGTR